MKYILILFVFIVVSFSCHTVKLNPNEGNDYVVLFRTDFSSDRNYNNIINRINNPQNEDGFKPNLKFVSNKNFKNKSVKELKEILVDMSYDHNIFFVLDAQSIDNNENPILCVSMETNFKVDRFRVLPDNMWIIENNISTTNLIFEELLFSVDKEGIYRTKI